MEIWTHRYEYFSDIMDMVVSCGQQKVTVIDDTIIEIIQLHKAGGMTLIQATARCNQLVFPCSCRDSEVRHTERANVGSQWYVLGSYFYTVWSTDSRIY